MCAASYQLVSIDLDSGPSVQFRVPESTKQCLAELHDDITPIAAVGPYRSGKSWMLGYLSKQPAAFQTSNGSQACTRGIHINTQPFTTKRLLFMDTEGLGAPGSNVEVDSKILACAILFAAKVYFFVVGKIDTKLLDSLQCAIGTANWLKDAANHECFNFQRPQLVVVIKDLTLQLQDKEGKPIGANEYFQTCLDDYCTTNNSELKVAINSLFSSITCLTTTIPCAEQDMKEMTNLYSKFQSDVAAVARDAYNGTQAKCIAEQTNMNGPILLQMAEQLCAALSQPGAPRLVNVWQAAMEQAALERKHKLLNQFHNKLLEIAPSTNHSSLYLTSFDHLEVVRVIVCILGQSRQSFKGGELAQLLQSMFAKVQELDQTRITSVVALQGQKPPQQWVLDHLPKTIATNIAQLLQDAQDVQLKNEELTKDLQDKSDALALIEDQIATLAAAASSGVPQDSAAVLEMEQKLEDAQRNYTQAQTYADEILVMHTTFQTEIKDQVAKNIEMNEQLKHDLLHAQQELQHAIKKNEDLTSQLSVSNVAVKQLKTTADDAVRKRKLDDIRGQQFEVKLEHAMKRATDMEQRLKEAQDKLRNKDDECQRLRIDMMRAQCSSLFTQR